MNSFVHGGPDKQNDVKAVDFAKSKRTPLLTFKLTMYRGTKWTMIMECKFGTSSR